MAFYCPSCSATIDEEHAGEKACPFCAAVPEHGSFGRDPRIGESVAGGQYRVVRRIGAGGFGTVYEVETSVGGLRRALKVLHERWASDDDTVARFVNEAIVLEEINHPNVARCFAAGRMDDAGEPYLLFELIGGVQLSELEAPLEPRRALRLTKQIAAGLAAAHASNVLHRDLKPDNVLVLDEGTPRERVKVVDFGIAKLAPDGETHTRTVAGTPEFMAPEQFLPGTPLDYRVDLWQLGAVLYWMLTGRSPYAEHKSWAAIMAAQQACEGLGPSPAEHRPALREHGAVDALVRRLLSTEVDARPRRATDVCEELARLEHALDPRSGRSGSESLLGALTATPSASAWLALLGYLGATTEARAEQVTLAGPMLEGWPAELRRAPVELCEHVKQHQAHELWPLVRSLDLSCRELDDVDVADLAQNPALAALTHLDLSGNAIGNEGVDALAASPHLAGLAHLDLSGNRITSQALGALARSAHLTGLRSLRLAHNGVGARGIEALAGGALRLRVLDISENDVGADGARALAAAPALAELEVLRARSNRLGSDGAAALFVSEHLRGLRELDLGNNGIGASGAAAASLSENVRRLRALGLGQNELGREGLQLLLGSRTFDDLSSLDLSGNGLGPAGAMLLAGSPFVRRLHRLDVSDDGLGDAGVAALLGSAQLAGLRELDLSQNQLTAAGASLLAEAPPQLEVLRLGDNPLGAAGAISIAEAMGRLRLRTLGVRGAELPADGLVAILDAARLLALDASRNPLGLEGAGVLAHSVGLRTIEALDLRQTNLGPDGVAAFLASDNLGSVRRLDLSSCLLRDAGVTAMVAHAPRLPRVEHLLLDHDEIGPDGVEALSVSPLATRLESLSLCHNELGDAGAEVLARGPSWHALRRVALAGNGIGLSGAAAIVASSRLGTVQHLDLSHNALRGLADMHSLKKDRVGLMEGSFGLLASQGADFAERFYDELFMRYPRVKPLFGGTDMARQRGHLLRSLVLVIDNLRSPDAATQALVELGRRHVGYGVVPTYYYAVTSTLIDTMQAMLGDDFTPEVREAWQEGMDAINQVMMSGARTSASPDPSVVPTREL